jgi:hypothetical protein
MFQCWPNSERLVCLGEGLKPTQKMVQHCPARRQPYNLIIRAVRSGHWQARLDQHAIDRSKNALCSSINESKTALVYVQRKKDCSVQVLMKFVFTLNQHCRCVLVRLQDAFVCETEFYDRTVGDREPRRTSPS